MAALLNAALNAVLQFVLLGGVPLAVYGVYQRRRHKRTYAEIAARVGLQIGEPRYLLYSLALALVGIVGLVLWSPPVDLLVREGSALQLFAGLGLTTRAVSMALLYGVVQTALTEELLFRGLIAGSLSRRLRLSAANHVQALIFLAPHLLLLTVIPESWVLLPLIFAGALLFGWIRLRSGSILGSLIMHAAGNVSMAVMVAVRASL